MFFYYFKILVCKDTMIFLQTKVFFFKKRTIQIAIWTALDEP